MTLPLYHPVKHTADKEAAISGACIIYAAMVHANGANCDVQLSDALTDIPTDDLKYSALDGDTIFIDYSDIGGVSFSTGLTVDLQGSGGSIILWTDRQQVIAV